MGELCQDSWVLLKSIPSLGERKDPFNNDIIHRKALWKQSHIDTLLISKLFTPFVPICSQFRLLYILSGNICSIYAIFLFRFHFEAKPARTFTDQKAYSFKKKTYTKLVLCNTFSNGTFICKLQPQISFGVAC